MESSAPWRALESDGDSSSNEHTTGGSKLWARPVLLVVAVGLAIAALTAAVMVASQSGGQTIQVTSASGDSPADTPAAGESRPALVVEVSGAVARPGVYSLPAGSRVGDAIAAAGGYAADVDPRQAEVQLNLAARLSDAQLIHVPRRGEASSSPSRAARATGPLDLNTATAEELDTLPGIGPVTAQKIIAARERQPFKSVNELLSRKIVSASTLAKLRALVTVG